MTTMLFRFFSRAAGFLQGIATRLDPAQDSPEIRRTREWLALDADGSLRLDYALDASSIVLDVGGYKGDWTAALLARNGCCNIHVFEPMPQFAEQIERRFAHNDSVQVHRFGLGRCDHEIILSAQHDASSAFVEGGPAVCVEVRDAAEFIASAAPGHVEVMKVNIEGGEYELLEHLLDAGVISRIVNVQVQFHDFVEDAARRMTEIRRRLAETHDLTYHVDFVWENWKRRA